jgi:Trk K+ transport system NAD-binding subunit
LTAKVLNPNVSLLVKSTTTIHTENLKDLEVENIINPFEIIAKNVDISLNRPNITKLKNWIYNKSLLDENDLYLKKGKYIICGFGRFGSEVYTVLKQNGIDVVCVDIDKNKLPRDNNISKDIIIGNGEDKNVLIQAEIMQSEVILALTNDDTTNLSILKTAQKLNKDLVAIARENEVQDLSIFSNSKIDKVFVLSDILISKAVNILANPYSEIFASLAQKQDEHWASAVVVDLVKTLGLNPIKFSITINETQAPQVVKLLKNKQNITLELLRISRHNSNHRNNLIPLLISNDGQNELLPKYDTQLKINDTILFASDDNAKDDVEYICQNHNEMNYVLTEYNTK